MMLLLLLAAEAVHERPPGTPSMYGGPRGAADAGLFLRLPFAAFAALFTEGREMQVGVGPGPEPARF